MVAGGAIAFAADGDLYLTAHDGSFKLLRLTPQGKVSVFNDFGSFFSLHTVAADTNGHVYVGVRGAEIFRYDQGNPDSKQLLAQGSWNARHSMTMSPDQTSIYLWRKPTLFRINPVDGTITTLAEVPADAGPSAGIAVVPIPPPPIPTVSGWSLWVMALLVLTGGTILVPHSGHTPLSFPVKS